MKTFSRSPLKRSEALHKYLKPGDLARIRDSKISARSHKSDELLCQIALSRISSDQNQAVILDQIPQFFSYSYGPRYLRRKKLIAAKSVNLQGLEYGSTDSFINVANADALAAH